jgi:hypothetical protein
MILSPYLLPERPPATHRKVGERPPQCLEAAWRPHGA